MATTRPHQEELRDNLRNLCTFTLYGVCPHERAIQLADGYSEFILDALEKFRDGCIHHDDSDILNVNHAFEKRQEMLDFTNFDIFERIKQRMLAEKGIK